mmetsp:Transcript_9764/g.22001  ORF Transcript_9764/g.22001 Transcript_9764/m.22001 type:complete len:201 (-) Transcript_9764:1413-2015(-)
MTILVIHLYLIELPRGKWSIDSSAVGTMSTTIITNSLILACHEEAITMTLLIVEEATNVLIIKACQVATTMVCQEVMLLSHQYTTVTTLEDSTSLRHLLASNTSSSTTKCLIIYIPTTLLHTPIHTWVHPQHPIIIITCRCKWQCSNRLNPRYIASVASVARVNVSRSTVSAFRIIRDVAVSASVRIAVISPRQVVLLPI